MGLRIACAVLCLLVSSARADDDVGRMLAAAYAQSGVTTGYDPAYAPLAYPGGDVALDRGVCSDVLIRALRAVGVDLQVEVHRDMRSHFLSYPALWGLGRPDPSIDHRRVPNLETYFRRSGRQLAANAGADSYLAGDFVSWRLDRGLPHIGIVAAERSADRKRPLIIHNIGAGVQVEDVLFQWPISGHFRYFPAPIIASAGSSR